MLKPAKWKGCPLTCQRRKSVFQLQLSAICWRCFTIFNIMRWVSSNCGDNSANALVALIPGPCTQQSMELQEYLQHRPIPSHKVLWVSGRVGVLWQIHALTRKCTDLERTLQLAYLACSERNKTAFLIPHRHCMTNRCTFPHSAGNADLLERKMASPSPGLLRSLDIVQKLTYALIRNST